MEIGNRKNWEIDRIGKAILAADRLREDEIEEIADAPHLLPGILARIDAGSTAAPAKFAARTDRVSVLKVWMIAPAAAAMAVLLAVLFLFAYRGESREDVFLAAPPDEIESAAPETSVPAEQPPVPAVDEVAPRRPRNTIAVQASAVEKTAKRPAAKRKPADQPLEFYALSSGGDPADMLKDGRIVRVDLPRTSLLSLGVNVPLESETAVVKTDLLIGSDGVTKAIRVVK